MTQNYSRLCQQIIMNMAMFDAPQEAIMIWPATREMSKDDTTTKYPDDHGRPAGCAGSVPLWQQSRKT